jgi:hypothetical protein
LFRNKSTGRDVSIILNIQTSEMLLLTYALRKMEERFVEI